jgi:hypothetical protein
MNKRVGKMNRMLLGSAGIVAIALQGGCFTMRAYDGESRSRDELAHIVGDWRLTAGAPLSVILRRVDDLDVGLRYSGVDLAPGQHHLLVDCTVNATKRISRHNLDVEVYEGRYKLVADTQPGNRECSEVRLVSAN